jgi:UDP-N-acetylmuramoyl-L-alanyl-D-glutamate--2,6-diaminopimelate ligase
VDYAHTPNAFVELYKTLTKLKTNRLITVAGCGGDKDKEKRPAMARVTFENSDLLILTSDNPRMEEPQQIVDDMLKGIPPNAPNVTVILDRKKAIAYACSLAKSQDIVLVAGKGHEKYQEIKGVKHPFDDKLVLSEMLGMA